MTPTDCFRRMRQDFLAGKHRMGELYFPKSALEDACFGDVDLLHECMQRLDDVTPDGWSFCQYVDGAAWEGDEIVYRYGRQWHEVTRLFARACDRSSNPNMRALNFQGEPVLEVSP